MRYTALLIAALFLLGAFASVSAAGEKETAVSPSESAQMSPAIWGSDIVWEDYRNSPGGAYAGPGAGNPDIYLYNISTHSEKAICTESHAQQNPDIYNGVVVWEDYRNGNADIYIYDTKDPSQQANGTRLTFNSAAQVNPRIFGHYVVWIDYRNGLDGDIYAYDLSSDSNGNGIPDWKEANYGSAEAQKAIKPICRDIYEQRDVAIYANTVVWKDYRNDTGNGDRNIFGYNLSTGREFQITTERHNQFQPAIWGNKVVWVDMRDGVGSIYGKDLKTGETFTLVPDGHAQRQPSIYENTVVWTESTGNHSVIMESKIGSKKSTRISGNWAQMQPCISRSGTVWVDGRVVKEVNGRDIPLWNIYFIRSLDANLPPVISDVNVEAPEKVVSGANFNITVNARVYDPEGDNFTVYLEVQGQSYRMYDDGMHGDEKAGDGIYGITINLTANSSKIQLNIVAQDILGASSCSTRTLDISTGENPVNAAMNLLGAGIAILILILILAAVYVIRKKSTELDEGQADGVEEKSKEDELSPRKGS